MTKNPSHQSQKSAPPHPRVLQHANHKIKKCLSPDNKHYARRPTEPNTLILSPIVSHALLLLLSVRRALLSKCCCARAGERQSVLALSAPYNSPISHRVSATLSLLRHGSKFSLSRNKSSRRTWNHRGKGGGFRRVKLTTSAAENKKKERHQMLGPVIGYTRALKKKKKKDEKKMTICA